MINLYLNPPLSLFMCLLTKFLILIKQNIMRSHYKTICLLLWWLDNDGKRVNAIQLKLKWTKDNAKKLVSFFFSFRWMKIVKPTTFIINENENLIVRINFFLLIGFPVSIEYAALLFKRSSKEIVAKEEVIARMYFDL